MKSKITLLLSLLVLGILLAASDFSDSDSGTEFVLSKVNGVNFVAPVKKLEKASLNSLSRINADWIAVIPYAYTRKSTSKVIFYHKHPHWWGEGVEGAIETIRISKEKGLKVMLKPQVWVIGDGWPGDFAPDNESDWKKWEADYTKYALTYAHICDSMDVDLFCIATEYRKAVQQRPEFWFGLIKKIREIYTGPLTYASNWDNYKNVSFWMELDFIGIDAYFPLSDKKTPSVAELEKLWQKELYNIAAFSSVLNKKVLFTEYGYRSCDYAAHTQWDVSEEHEVNLTAQANSYQALYAAVWNKNWMAGGFLWKWFANDSKAGGNADRNFTPQNKPAEEIVRHWYSK